jgi:hypothetical protein
VHEVVQSIQPWYKVRPYLKNNQHKKDWQSGSVVEHLSRKSKVLSSNTKTKINQSITHQSGFHSAHLPCFDILIGSLAYDFRWLIFTVKHNMHFRIFTKTGTLLRSFSDSSISISCFLHQREDSKRPHSCFADCVIAALQRKQSL